MAKAPSKRELALRTLRAAGAQGDRQLWTRVYVENRISLPVAQAAWREGVRFAESIAARDNTKGGAENG